MADSLRLFLCPKTKKGLRVMSKHFMNGTPLGGIEQMMMLTPNFSPKGGGGVIVNNNARCKGGIQKCDECRAKIKSRDNPNDCLYFIEKRQIGKVEYRNLLKDCFGKIKNYSLQGRLKLFDSKFTGELFLNNNHKKRFYEAHRKHDLDLWDRSPRYLAVLFLFTADEVLWNVSKQAVFLYGFDFSSIHLRQISTEGYSLYQMAKTIWIGKEYIRINEIADMDLINDIAFKAIINASLITRYGAAVFLLENRMEK